LSCLTQDIFIAPIGKRRLLKDVLARVFLPRAAVKMPSFGFLERREVLSPSTTIPDPTSPVLATTAQTRLTGPLRLDPANAASDAYGLAVLAQTSFPSSELAELRFGALPEKESLAYLTQIAERGIREKLSDPGIGAVDVLADLPGKGTKVVHEHLVIRDLELPPFVGGEDDVAIAMGKKIEGRREGEAGEGRIVSHAEWVFRPRDWVEQWEEEQRRKGMGSVLPPPKGTNVALIEDFETKVNAMWVNLMKGREHYGE
jgi:hypothetical protein